MSLVYVVRSRLDEHQGKPFLGIFLDPLDAKKCVEIILLSRDDPDYLRWIGYVWYDTIELDKFLG